MVSILIQYFVHCTRRAFKPIARTNDLHGGRAAATFKSDDAGGLHAILYLAEEASVCLQQIVARRGTV